MNHPPSLSVIVLARSFRAGNGELGVMPSDAMEFLDACEADNVELSGWELWVVDHKSVPSSREPQPAPGQWCGPIPVRGDKLPHIIHGEGDLAETRQMMRMLDLSEIKPEWLAHIRINFALG